MRGRVRKWLNNVLIHLHNYTAGRYRVWGVYCIVVGGEVGLGGWCGIGGWINLRECCQGGIPCDSNGYCFGALISNLVAIETKTWGEGFENG